MEAELTQKVYNLFKTKKKFSEAGKKLGGVINSLEREGTIGEASNQLMIILHSCDKQEQINILKKLQEALIDEMKKATLELEEL